MVEAFELKQRQSLPLDAKIILTKQRIKNFYDHYNGQVYVSFSGGKDSTVLLHLVRSMYPDVKALFVDTGLEYPEIKEFVKNTKNTITIRPDMCFTEVIKKYGYPVISKQNAYYIDTVRRTKSDYLRNRIMTGFMKDEERLCFI